MTLFKKIRAAIEKDWETRPRSELTWWDKFVFFTSCAGIVGCVIWLIIVL